MSHASRVRRSRCLPRMHPIAPVDEAAARPRLWTTGGYRARGVVPCSSGVPRPVDPGTARDYPADALGQGTRGGVAEVGSAACRRSDDDECPGSHRGAAGARGVGDHPEVDAGGGPGHGRAGRRPAQRGRVDPRRPPRAGPSRGRPHRRPAARHPVPSGRGARVRGARRRDAAGRRRRRERARVLGRRGRGGDRRRRRDLRRPRRVRHRRRRVRQARRGRHRRRDRAGRGREPGDRPALPRHRRRLGPRQGAGRLQAAARARARRVLDLRLLHRRPLPHRRQPRAARHRARRRRPDEPDQRHLPAPRPDGDRATSSRASSTSSRTRRRSTSSSWSSTRSSR